MELFEMLEINKAGVSKVPGKPTVSDVDPLPHDIYHERIRISFGPSPAAYFPSIQLFH